MVMPFGQYKGQSLSSLPDAYLEWLITIAYEPLLSHLQKEIRRRNFHQATPQSSVPVNMAQKIITSGFRQLAMELHPDHGGDHQRMLELNHAHDWLKQQLTVLR
jgi:Putative quorum-sensing-regulated virulence factor